MTPESGREIVLKFGRIQHPQHSRGALVKHRGSALAELTAEIDDIAKEDSRCMLEWQRMVRGIEPSTGVVIDLGASTYVGTGRISHIVRIRQEVSAQGGRVVIVATDATARAVLKLCRIDTVIPVCESLSEARYLLASM